MSQLTTQTKTPRRLSPPADAPLDDKNSDVTIVRGPELRRPEHRPATDVLEKKADSPPTAALSAGNSARLMANFGTWGTYPPAPLILPTPNPNPQLTGSLLPNHAGISGGQAAPNHTDTWGVGGNRWGISAQAGQTHENTSSGTSGFLMNGWAHLAHQVTWGTPGGDTHSWNGLLGGWSHYLGAGVSRKITTQDGYTLAVGCFVGGGASRTVSDLGNYRGPEPKLDGSRHIEVVHQTSSMRAFSGGVSNGVAGMGVGITRMRSKKITYRTHLPPAKAKAVLFENASAIRRYFRNVGRALGIIKAKIKIPNPRNFKSLQVEDLWQATTTGTVMAGLSAGAFGVRAGAHAVITGEFDIAVKKLTDTTVSLSFQPLKVKALKIFADVPIVFEAGVDWANINALKQNFVFDLATAEGKKAYLAALDGNFPAIQPKIDLHKPKADLHAAMAIQDLPDSPGVQPAFIDKVHVSEKSKHVGTKWGTVPSRWGFLGYLKQRIQQQLTRLVSNGNQSISIHTTKRVKRRALFLRGTRHKGMTTTRREVSEIISPSKVVRRFAGLTLTYQYDHTRLRKRTANKLIKRLNKIVGTSFPKSAATSKTQQRSIGLERTLWTQDFSRLAKLEPDVIQRACRLSGASKSQLRSLLHRLQKATTVNDKASLVQVYIKKTGLVGFGAIVRCLEDSPKKIRKQSSRAIYTKTTKTAATLAFRYQKPISGNENIRALHRRIKSVSRVLDRIDQALRYLADDPLLEKKPKMSHFEALTRARGQMLRAISIDHLSPDEFKSLEYGLRRHRSRWRRLYGRPASLNFISKA